MITYKELNIKAKELEKKTGLQHLDIYRRFMFERILERISVSYYFLLCLELKVEIHEI